MFTPSLEATCWKVLGYHVLQGFVSSPSAQYGDTVMNSLTITSRTTNLLRVSGVSTSFFSSGATPEQSPEASH